MPLPKNIWIAAADGDLATLRGLIEHHALSPNVPDDNTYTPMHAAASYAQLRVLDYLISKGGDVNITDNDGDTPLFTVENIETAKFLVEHGAVIGHRNNEGISPIEHLQEEYPDVANYLQSLTSSETPSNSDHREVRPSRHQQEVASEQLTSQLVESVRDIMDRAEAEGRDPENELRQAVGRAVLEGVATGYGMTEDQAEATDEGSPHKKQRLNGGPG